MSAPRNLCGQALGRLLIRVSRLSSAVPFLISATKDLS